MNDDLYTQDLARRADDLLARIKKTRLLFGDKLKKINKDTHDRQKKMARIKLEASIEEIKKDFEDQSTKAVLGLIKNIA